MLNDLYRIITDLMYLVPLQVWRFKSKEPEASILVAAATKAQKRDRDAEVQSEAGWIISRRGALILTTDKLICGSWEIPLSSVTRADLVRFKSAYSKGLVLKVATTDGSHYQFGLQYNPTWETQTAIKLSQASDNAEFIPLKMSRFSQVLRIVVILFLLYYILTQLVIPLLSALFVTQ